MSWVVFEDYRQTAPTKRGETPGDKPGTSASGQTFFHPRRTLDQFYYPALDDTSIRDSDQTISKWSGKDVAADGKSGATNDSLLIMIDQLWCWVVDGSPSPMLSNIPWNANVHIRHCDIKLPILIQPRWLVRVH